MRRLLNWLLDEIDLMVSERFTPPNYHVVWRDDLPYIEPIPWGVRE